MADDPAAVFESHANPSSSTESPAAGGEQDNLRIPWWRRCLRFRLLTVLMLLTVLAVVLAGPVRRAHLQRQAVAAVRDCGGIVFYDWQRQNASFQPPPPGGGPAAPKWLRQLIGDEYFQTIVNVTPTRVGVVGDRRSGNRRIQPVTTFSIGVPSWTTADPRKFEELLRCVGKLKSLERLSLADATINDEMLAHLSGLRQLKRLDLSSTDITGEGLECLRSMRKLEELNLCGTRVGDSCLHDLRHLKQLSDLDLCATQVRGWRLEQLAELPKLRWLDLSENMLDANAAVKLAACSRWRPSTCVAAGSSTTGIFRSLPRRGRAAGGRVGGFRHHIAGTGRAAQVVRTSALGLLRPGRRSAGARTSTPQSFKAPTIRTSRN